MKQILQSLRTGATEVADVPRPAVGPGQLLIRTSVTLISSGTERTLVEFGKSGWIDKARQQPDKVRVVLDKVKTDGIAPTFDAVMRKLDEPLATGYCNVGHVVEVGKSVSGFQVGDRVASNGKHAGYVAVPVNLCARIPDAVSDESAAFTVIGAIALQGIRLAQPTLGECVVVTGLGLVGLMAVQLLRAQGCRVLGLDFDARRLELARGFGAETFDLSAGGDPLPAAQGFSRGRGVDAVLITASTASNEPVHQAAQMCRKRGRIVLVGVAGLELSRADFYEKEISFQVSCSYGPGRYDPRYEQEGHDYPAAYVRWTEQRNLEAVLDMLAESRLDVAPLITHRFAASQAVEAYRLVDSDEQSLGIVLEFEEARSSDDDARSIRVNAPAKGDVSVGFIGAGQFATATLIPAFRDAGARLKIATSATGVSATHAARKLGIEESGTESNAVLSDSGIDAAVICTRHASHASWASRALAAGKHAFVEKPLAMTFEDLAQVDAAYRDASRPASILMVGFNRRFAPLVRRMKSLLEGVGGPRSFVMTVNAGAIPASHWTQDPRSGGGRIVGEVCHFVDLLRFLAASPIASHRASAMRDAASITAIPDTISITLSFANGSIGTIHYFANGHRSVAKERLEVYAAGRVLALDNFRKLRGHGWPGFTRMSLWRQDKGHRACVAEFVRAIREGAPAPIDYAELLEVSRVTLEIDEAIANPGS